MHKARPDALGYRDMLLASPPAFVGRESELAMLREPLHAVLAGRAQVVLLAGEPGIGKTRLAEELARDAARAGACVAWGRGYEGEGAPAYWPWLQILRDCLGLRGVAQSGANGSAGGRALQALPITAAAEIARLLPELRELRSDLPAPIVDPDPAQARFRLFESVARLLALTAASRPLLLVLDDLHWADASTLLLLEFVARELREARLLVVATFRDADLDRSPELQRTLGALARGPNVARLSLAGLPEQAVAQLVAAVADATPSHALVAGLLARTDGNPLFVVEISRMLPSTDVLSDLAGAALSGVPPTVKELLGRRLHALSAACERTLVAAAVLGHEFDVEVLHRALGVERDALLQALAEAERAGLIEPLPERFGRYCFGHALVREALYDDLPAADRARLHRDAGLALEAIHEEDLEPYLSELAWHFAQAAPAGEGERALAYAERAAARAAHLFAYEEAIRHLQLALALARAGRRRCELLILLGEAQSFAGEMAAARESFEQAAAQARDLGALTGDREAALLLARAAADVSRVAVIVEVDEGRIQLLEEALRALGQDERESPLRARLLISLASSLHYGGRAARRDALLAEGLALARRSGDREVLAFALFIESLMLWRPEQLDGRLALAAEIERLGEEMGQPYVIIEAARLRIAAQLDRGDRAGLDAALAAHARLAETLRQPIHRWRSIIWHGMRALLEGHFTEVERLLGEARELAHQARHPDTVQWLAAQLSVLRRDQGRLAEIVPSLQGFVARYPTGAVWRAALAAALAELGRLDEARREVERLDVALAGMAPAAQAELDGFAVLPQLAEGLLTATYLAEACAATGDRDRAARLYGVLLPFAGHGVALGPAIAWYGTVEHRLGLLAVTLGRSDATVRHLERALAVYERMAAKPWTVRARLALAATLLQRRAIGPAADAQRERSARLLQQAQATAAEIGMPDQIEQARRLWADFRTTPQREQASEQPKLSAPPGGLTEREAEILALVAAGLSNPEIAERLVVSRSTVQNHLINIYRKLDVGGRAEAAAYAVQHGLLRPERPA